MDYPIESIEQVAERGRAAARVGGVQLQLCPYAPNTPHARAWHLGYSSVALARVPGDVLRAVHEVAE